MLIIPCKDATVLRYFIISFATKWYTGFFFFFLPKSIRNRDLVDEWISYHAYSKKIFKVIQKLCSLLNRAMEGKINDFYIELTIRSCLPARPSGIKFQGNLTHYMHFLIPVPNARSNTALWNATIWTTNVWTLPANLTNEPMTNEFRFLLRISHPTTVAWWTLSGEAYFRNCSGLFVFWHVQLRLNSVSGSGGDDSANIRQRLNYNRQNLTI